MMNYQQTIEFLFEQLPFFQNKGATALKLDLSRTLSLADFFGNPHLELKKCIHIGGTNGKGSTSHLIAAPLIASGLKVGMYTSPHYKDFRERIKIGNQFIPESYVIDFVRKAQPAIDKWKPSFFELTFVMALCYFRDQDLDVCIIEVGLGGRLDSTNIIQSILSVITNIGHDHQQFLGDTLPLIANEKAGIIKKNIPVIIGKTQTETSTVFIEKAKKESSEIIFADQIFETNIQESSLIDTKVIIKKEGKILINTLVDVAGAYQIENIQTAYTALDWMIKNQIFEKLSQERIIEGWEEVKKLTHYIGRWQVLSNKPLVICDSAHNREGLEWACKYLGDISNLHIMLAFSKDKNVDEVLPLFPKEATFYFTQFPQPRTMPAETLKQKAEKYNLEGNFYSNHKEALASAKANAKASGNIFILGSIFLVAEFI